MMPIGRNLTVFFSGFLLGKKWLLNDQAPTFLPISPANCSVIATTDSRIGHGLRPFNRSGTLPPEVLRSGLAPHRMGQNSSGECWPGQGYRHGQRYPGFPAVGLLPPKGAGHYSGPSLF